MDWSDDSLDIESQFSGNTVERETEEEDLCLDADTIILGWKRLFQLPFQPIWHYSMLMIAVFQIYLSIYQAGVKVYGKRDGLINSDFAAFRYISDVMYAADILLIIGCKKLHGLEISPLEILRPNWVLLADVVSIIPAELFIPMRPLTPLKAKLYYVAHLLSCFKIVRILNTFHYTRNTVRTSKIHLQVFEYYFSMGLAVLIGFVLTYHIICLDYGCEDVLPLEDYFRYLYIAVSRITARGLAVYPTNIYWLLCISIMGMVVFATIICTSIAYVTIALYTLLYHKYEFLNKLKLIHREFETLDVPKDIAAKCTEFYDMFWKKRTGYDDNSSYSVVLPRSMYEDITLDVAWYALKHSKLLRDLDIPFLRHVSVFVKSKFALPGEIIYDKYNTKDMMVYVVSGVVQILSQEDDETPILSLSGGTCLGESSLILNYNPKGMVRCKTFCKLHVLETKSFVKLIKLFPAQFLRMRSNFNIRLETAQKYHALSVMVNLHFGVRERTDYMTIMWLKTTLHRLMSKKGHTSARNQCQNIFLRDEFNDEKFIDRHYSAKNLDLLVISEKLELITDTVFLKNSCPCIFKPDSIILNAWEAIIVFLAIMAAFLVPYFAFVEPSTPLWYEALVYLFTIFWVLDLYVKISTAVETSDEIKATVMAIFFFRLGTAPFLVDVVSAVPIEFFSSILLWKVSPQYRALLYMNRIIKIWRVHSIFGKWENELHADLILIRYFKYCCVLCYTAYLCACAIFAINCFDSVCIVRIDTRDTFQQLLWCLEVSISILTGVCIASRLTTQRMYYPFYLFLNLLSMVFYVFFYGSLAAEYALKRANRIKLAEMLTDLCSIMKTSRLRHKYDKRIFSYVETQWADNSAATLLYADSILADLPPHIYEALRETTHKEILLSAPLFRDLPEEFILDICSAVRDVILPPNEVVCYTGEICDTFCFISKGYCRVVSGATRKKQQILGPTESISAVEACLRVPTVNTVITITHCRLVTIDYSALNQLYIKNPGAREELQSSLDEVEVKSKLQRLFRATSIGGQYGIVTEDEEGKSFREFGNNLRVDSFEEYDYYVPFDRLAFFSFVQYFLLRRTVLPESKFLFMWEIFRCVFAVLSAVFFPINNIGTCIKCMWYFLLALLDGMAWLDIYLRFHVCYYNEDGVLVTHPLKTAIYYFKHGLLVDLCAVFPVHLIFSAKDHTDTLSLLQLNRVLQMHRYIGFFDYVETNTLLPAVTLSTLKYFPVIFVCCTCIGSAMISQICDFGASVPKSTDFTAGVICTNNSWITQSSFTKPLSPMRVQAYAVYFTASILTTAGMMGFKIYSSVRGALTLVLSIVAYILSAHIVGKVISQYTVADSTLLAYQDSMRSVFSFMHRNKVRLDLQRDLLAHYELKWQRKQGRDLRESISRFNRSLQQDILYDVYGRTLQETSVFVSDSKAFLRNLMLEVRHDVNMKSSFITTVNNVTKYLHILYKGKVGVIAPDGSRIAILTPGSMFGNLDNYDMVRQTVSIVAMGHVEVLSIEALRFHAILGTYPRLQKRFKYLTTLHVDYLEGRGRVAAEDELTCSTNSSLMAARISWSKNPLAAVQHAVFNPASMFVRIWQVVILVGVCYVEVCFDLYQLAMAEYAAGFVALQYVCDLLYLVDYFVKTHTAFENDVGLLVKDLHMIQQRFRQNRVDFWLNIVSAIPFDVFAWFAPPTVFRVLHPILRLNRWLRFMHVINHFKQQKEKLDLNPYVWRFTYIILWSTFILHFCTCALIALGCTHTPNMHPEIKYKASTSTYEKLMIYTKYYYLVVSCLIRASQGVVYPQSLPLTIYCVFLMIFLLLVNAIFLAQVYTTLQIGYQRLNIYAQKLERIRSYMKREQLSVALYEKACEYLRFLWRKQNGTNFPRLLEEAPSQIQESILNSAFGYHINNHFVFKGCHVDFNRQLVACLRSKTYFKDDYVVMKGSIDRSMYFVHTGKVNVLSEDDSLNETVVESLEPGMSFGVTQGLSREKPYSYSFSAAKTTVVLCLYLDMWEHLLRFFPATQATIRDRYGRYGDKYA